MKHRIFALVLAAALLFTGCGAPKADPVPEVSGGYQEQKIEFPDDFYCTGIYPQADNSVTMLGASGWQGRSLSGFDQDTQKAFGYSGGILIYDVKPDGTVTQRPTPWEDDLIFLCADSPHEISMAMDESGTLYVLAAEIYTVQNHPKTPFQLYRVDGDRLVSIEMDFSSLPEDWFPPCVYDIDRYSCKLNGVTNDSLFITNNGASWGIWDTSGTMHKSYVLRDGSSINIQAIRNGYVWTGNTNDYELAYALPDFKSAGSFKTPDGFVFPDWDGTGFYHMSYRKNFETNEEQEPLFSHYDLNGNSREILMHGNEFSLASQSVWLGAETPDHAFWMILNDMGIQSLCRYSYNPDKTFENTLTIFSMHTNNTLSQTISLWNQQHPEIQIKHIIGTNQNALTNDEIVRQLSAQLLDGNGPDLIFLDDLPAESLIQQGVFADLSDLIPTDNLRPNVHSAFELDGILYAIPAGMNAYIAGGLTDDVDDRILTLNGLADAVEDMPDPDNSHDSCLSFVVPLYEHLFDLFYPASTSAIWQDGHFNADAFLTFTEQLNRIAQQHDFKTIATYDKTLDEADSETDSQWYQRYPLSSINEFWNGNGHWFTDCLNHMTTISSFSRIVRNEDGQITNYDYLPISLYPLPGTTENGVFTPTCIAAIPKNNTKNRPLAEKFIQLMLSDPIQGSAHHLEGLPVTYSGFNSAMDEVLKHDPVILTTDLNELLDNMQPALSDPSMQAAVREAAANLYDGTYTEEEACNAIEQAFELQLTKQ